MDLNATVYDMATKGVSTQVSSTAVESQLPGRENGPADAYRHILLAAELVRRFGETYANKLLDGHEWTGNNGGQTPKEEAMDKHNNEIGKEIGKKLALDPNSKYKDVVKEVQKKFDSTDNNGSGARWLPEADWKKNPVGLDGKRIPNGDSRLNWPPAWEKKLPLGDANNNNIPDILEGNWQKKPKSPILPTVKVPFDDASKFRYPRDPIILDLDGNGIKTVGLAANVHFDYDADGVLTQTGWVGQGDALLVLDRNSNGNIDNGTELFGDYTPITRTNADGTTTTTYAPNGFAALASLDTNNDGIIDASDPAFGQLKLWRDTNQDGTVDQSTNGNSGELISLAQAGIVSLNLANVLKNQATGNGNTLTREGSFTKLVSY